MWALAFVRFPWLPTLQFLIILGGLQTIPQEVHESAAIDGAGFWRRLFYIDIPMTQAADHAGDDPDDAFHDTALRSLSGDD